MRIADARAIVEAARLDPTVYSFEGDRHEAVCIFPSGQDWHVFVSERGTRREERVFADEDRACVWFLTRLFQLARAN